MRSISKRPREYGDRRRRICPPGRNLDGEEPPGPALDAEHAPLLVGEAARELLVDRREVRRRPAANGHREAAGAVDGLEERGVDREVAHPALGALARVA